MSEINPFLCSRCSKVSDDIVHIARTNQRYRRHSSVRMFSAIRPGLPGTMGEVRSWTQRRTPSDLDRELSDYKRLPFRAAIRYGKLYVYVTNQRHPGNGCRVLPVSGVDFDDE